MSREGYTIHLVKGVVRGTLFAGGCPPSALPIGVGRVGITVRRTRDA